MLQYWLCRRRLCRRRQAILALQASQPSNDEQAGRGQGTEASAMSPHEQLSHNEAMYQRHRVRLWNVSCPCAADNRQRIVA